MDPAQNLELCALCFSYHPLRYCRMFRKLTLEQRLYVVRTHKYCSNCFSRSHLIARCISMGACQICCDLHHTLLHPRSSATAPRRNQQQQHRPRQQQSRQRTRRNGPMPTQPQQRAQNRLDDLRLRLQQQQQVIQRQRQQLQQQQLRQPPRQQQQQQLRQPPRQQQRRQQQRRHQQPQTVAVPQPVATPASTQGLVNQIVSALSQLTGSSIAPVQGGRHVEVQSGCVEDDLIYLEDDLIDFDDGLTDLD